MSTEAKAPRPLSDHNTRVIKKLCRSLFDADVHVVYMLPLALMAGQEDDLSDQAEEFFEDMYSKANRRELARFRPEAARLAKRLKKPSAFFSELWFCQSNLPLFAVKWSSGGIHWVHIAKDREPGTGTLNGGVRAIFWTFGNSISACAKRAKRIARRRSLREWHLAYQDQNGCAWTPDAGVQP